jgi:predicted ABC-type transport system involved in lysophospholipase L1 biosynthesis ATPase subunit
MADPLLVFEGVVLRSEEGKVLLHGLDWSLARGAKVNVRITSGGDASALLRLASGLTQPQEGRIILDGIPLGPYTFDHPFLHRGAMGWVPREGGLLVNQSLLVNVALPLMFTKRMGSSAAEALAAKALDEAGLAEVADHRPHVLDPRERWLGALVRAALMEPELWLVDPPSGALNHWMQSSASVILDRAVASSAAMIVVGGDSWVPRSAMQALGLENGRMLPEDSDAIRA